MKYPIFIYLAFNFILANIIIEIIDNLNSKKSQVVAEVVGKVGHIYNIKGKVWIYNKGNSKSKEARQYDDLYDDDVLRLGAGASTWVKCNNRKPFEVTFKEWTRWPARLCNIRIRHLANDNNPGIGGIGGGLFANALNYDDRGFQVRRLQEDLQHLGFFTANPTGIFDSTTRDAVANFQRAYGLIPNGIADWQTLSRISQSVASNSYNPNENNCSSVRSEICLGEHSQRVIFLQQQLQQWGFFKGNADGYYGAVTRDAVAQFQRSAGLNATGFVDYQTWQALGFNNSTSQDYSQSYNYQQKPNYVQPTYAGYIRYPIQLPNSLPPAIIFPPLPPATTLPLRGNYSPQAQPFVTFPKSFEDFNTQPLITPNFPVPTNNIYNSNTNPALIP